jgi:hypothetical protein
MSPMRDAFGPVLLAIVITMVFAIYGFGVLSDYHTAAQRAEIQKYRIEAQTRIDYCRSAWEKIGAMREFRHLVDTLGIKPNIESDAIPPECEASS